MVVVRMREKQDLEARLLLKGERRCDGAGVECDDIVDQ